MINDLKEKVDEKDIEISNLQHSKTSAKFTSETQTSLADELHEAAQPKITNEKKALLEKFSEVQTKINLQINVLTKSIQSLKTKSPERCVYGWKCKRKFCKYSHEYLYSYNKFTSSECDETFATSEHVGKHQQNLHEDIQDISVNLHHSNSDPRKFNKKVVRKEQVYQKVACSSSSSSVTSSLTSLSSIASISSNSLISVNSSEREEAGGISISNSV